MVLSSQSGCIPFALKGKNNGDQDDIKQVVLNLDSPRDLPEKQAKKESSPPDLPLESEKTGVEDIVEQFSGEDRNIIKEQTEIIMEKTRTDVLIEKSKVNYNAVIKIIANMYDEIFSKNPEFGYKRKDIFADYDSYLQAILLKHCVIKDKFSKDAMAFIENVADYGKLIEGTDFNLFADCAKEMREVVSEKVEERLKEIPVCFKLAGAVDVSRGLGVMKAMLDSTVKIAFNLKYTDENADLKDNSDVLNSLKAIYVFAKSNGIDLK